MRRRWSVRSLVIASAAGAAVAAASLALHPRPLAAQVGSIPSRLVWYDRSGEMLGAIGRRGDYGNIELSPDGRRLGVAVLDRDRRAGDLWIYDVATGERVQFTSDPADENWLIWSPDGRRVAFNSARDGGLDLYAADASGHGVVDALLVDGLAKWPVSWSPDGRYILYTTNSEETGNDLWLLPLDGERQPRPFIRTEFQDNWGAISPDGRWVAYSSTETGQAEVYVVPFPGGGEQQRVSADGGFQARWRRDGREIFYLASDGTLMSTTVDGEGPAFRAVRVEPLFRTPFLYPPYRAYDVTADGQRFIMNTLVVTPGESLIVASATLGRGSARNP